MLLYIVLLVSFSAYLTFTSLLLHFHYTFTTLSLQFHYTFTTLSLHFHYTFTSLTLHFHYTFTTLSIHLTTTYYTLLHLYFTITYFIITVLLLRGYTLYFYSILIIKEITVIVHSADRSSNVSLHVYLYFYCSR